MTRYECDCRSCTNKYIDGSGCEWCKPTVDGFKTITVSSDTSGTRDDPDIISCRYFTTETKQAELYPWKVSKR